MQISQWQSKRSAIKPIPPERAIDMSTYNSTETRRREEMHSPNTQRLRDDLVKASAAAANFILCMYVYDTRDNNSIVSSRWRY